MCVPARPCKGRWVLGAAQGCTAHAANSPTSARQLPRRGRRAALRAAAASPPARCQHWLSGADGRAARLWRAAAAAVASWPLAARGELLAGRLGRPRDGWGGPGSGLEFERCKVGSRRQAGAGGVWLQCTPAAGSGLLQRGGWALGKRGAGAIRSVATGWQLWASVGGVLWDLITSQTRCGALQGHEEAA